MCMGILVCGLNGSGKSTLGRALAERLGFHFIDNEDLLFSKADPRYMFAAPRSHKEAEELLAREVKSYQRFVFAAVKGDYGDNIMPLYQFAVLMTAPRELRLQRVKSRSFERFGDRMRPGGDLYAPEKAFFDMVASRTEGYVEEWAQSLRCPILRVNGADPVNENVERILNRMREAFPAAVLPCRALEG